LIVTFIPYIEIPEWAAERSYLKFKTLYEPSAIASARNGALVVVEDETESPIHILNPADGLTSFIETPISTRKMFDRDGKHANFRKLGDLEGLDVDNEGTFYAVTSHTRSKKGRSPNREKLIRFRVEGQRITNPSVYGGLRDGLTAKYPVLRIAADVADVKNRNGFNIEGLSFNRDKKRMLIGFRGPVIDGKAMIVELENLSDIFEKNSAPQFGDDPIYLELGGQGIRGMKYDSRLDGYLIISGPVKKVSEPFCLWFWSGDPSMNPKRVSVDGVKDFERAEGITQVNLDGQELVMIVYDDGNREQKKPGSFLVFSYDDLQIG